MKCWRGVVFVLIITENKRVGGRRGTNMTINGDRVVQVIVPSVTGRHSSSYDERSGQLPN